MKIETRDKRNKHIGIPIELSDPDNETTGINRFKDLIDKMENSINY